MEKNLNIKLIEDKINNMKEFSGVIRINRAEEVLFEKAYGFADISNDRINNINTRFGIASGLKMQYM